MRPRVALSGKLSTPIDWDRKSRLRNSSSHGAHLARERLPSRRKIVFTVVCLMASSGAAVDLEVG